MTTRDKDGMPLAQRPTRARVLTLRSFINDGIEAAQEVVGCWERGDLAGAVNSLEHWMLDAIAEMRDRAYQDGDPEDAAPDRYSSNDVDDTEAVECVA
jgi:hypothetical protein